MQRRLTVLVALALASMAVPLPAPAAKTNPKPYKLHLSAPSKEDTGHVFTVKASGKAKTKRELIVLYHAFGKCAKTARAAEQKNGQVFLDRDVGPGKFSAKHNVVFTSPGNGDFCGYLVNRAKGLGSKPSARASRHITIF